jgi:hypothetical protein
VVPRKGAMAQLFDNLKMSNPIGFATSSQMSLISEQISITASISFAYFKSSDLNENHLNETDLDVTLFALLMRMKDETQD